MRGEYFSWLSHDDLYKPDKIEKNIAAIKDEPTRIVYSDAEVVDENGTSKGYIKAKNLPGYDYEFGLFPIVIRVLHGCTLLIHKSHFDIHGVLDLSLNPTGVI